jgi:hypothetical protein
MLTSSIGSASRNCVVHQGRGILKQCESTVGTLRGDPWISYGSLLQTVLLLFSLAAQLPSQDVSGDDQTHLGAAQTQFFCFLIHALVVQWPLRGISCLSIILHVQSMHNRTQILCMWIIHLFLNKDPLLI